MKSFLCLFLMIVGVVQGVNWTTPQPIPPPPLVATQSNNYPSFAYDSENGLMFAAWVDTAFSTPFFSIFPVRKLSSLKIKDKS